MINLREAAQMALDALNNFDKGNHGMRWQVPVIKALRTALAQPERAECDGGQCGIGGYCKECPKTQTTPVAWGFQNTGITGSNRWMYLKETIPADDQYRGVLWTPLYTAPPKKEWVGLTDADWIIGKRSADYIAGAEWAEAKLKEKNT